MYSVFYSEASESDLETITLYYIEHVSESFGLDVYQSIQEQIETLETYPKRIKKSDRIANAHEMVIDRLPYIAFFRIDEDNLEVEVLNIIHMARSYP
jgi:plasmid stabilization system protein ParE